MKIFTNKIKENWVVDKFILEWEEHNDGYITDKIKKSDIVWIIAPWTWNKTKKKYLDSKKVLCTIHHIDFEKFDSKEEKNFYERDEFVDEYHVISEITKNQLSKLTDKKISVAPFWIDESTFFNIKNKEQLRKKYEIPQEAFIIGSFQRDTEGFDLKTPKLSKGPDIFFEIVKEKVRENNNTEVLLAGTRRQYLINLFKENNIPYYYFEMASYKELNELYNLLDLYIVSSRVEGGPRSIFESAITKTPIISTNVGYASEILSPNSMFKINEHQKAYPDVNYAFEKVQNIKIPNGFLPFIDIFKDLYES